MQKAERASWAAVILGILLNFGATLFALQTDRPLVVDGSWWAYRVLSFKITSFGQNQFRYLTAALEYPAVLLSRQSTGEDRTAFILKVWEAGLVLHPYLSLLLCLWILKRARRLHLFPIVALALGLSGQIALSFPANQSAEVFSAFWPALCLLACGNLKRPLPFLGILGATVLLCLTHEAALLAFALFFAIAWWRGAPSYYLALFALGGIECIARSALGDYPTSQGLLRDTLSMPLRYPVHCTVVAGLLGLRLLAMWKKRYAAWEADGLFVLLVVCVLMAIVAPAPHIITLWNGRLLSIILGCLLGLYLFLWADGSPPRVSLHAVVALALLYSSHLDASATRSWKQGLDNLAALGRSRGPGCHFLGPQEFIPQLWEHGITNVYLPTLSMVLQKRKRLDYILFTQHEWAHLRPEEVCPTLRLTGVMSFFFDQRIFPSDYFSANFPVPGGTSP